MGAAIFCEKLLIYVYTYIIIKAQIKGREVRTVKRKKKKPTKTVDVATILVSALMDLIVGLLLLLVDKLT